MSSRVDLDLATALLEGARDRLRGLGPGDHSEALLVVHSLREGARGASQFHLLPRLDEISNDLASGAEGAVERARQGVRSLLERTGEEPVALEDELERCFVEEAGEHFDEARAQIARLAADLEDREAITELYRVVHTLKGSAGMVGRKEAVSSAHVLEELLQGLIDGSRQLAPSVVRGLEQAVDLLERLVSHPEQAQGLEAALVALTGGLEPGQSRDGGVAGVTARRAAPRRKEGSVAVRFDGAAFDDVLRASRRSRSTAALLRREVGAMRGELGALTPIADELMGLAEPGSSPFARRHLIEMARSLLDVVDAVDRQSTVVERAAGRLARTTARLEELFRAAQGVRAGWVFDHLEAAAEELAAQLDRQVAFLRVGEEVPLDRRLALWLAETLLHVVRNAIAHGLEPPPQRAAMGKDPAGRIALEARSGPGWISFSVYDDGRGVDLQAIRERALEKGLRDARAITAASDEEVLDWVFWPGLSTRREADLVAGRGVGLDAVRAEVRRRGGEIKVRTWPGRGTRFELVLPGEGQALELTPVEVGGVPLAIPSREVLAVARDEPRCRDASVSLATLLGLEAAPGAGQACVQTSAVTLRVDAVHDSAAFVVRSLGGRLARVGPYLGVASGGPERGPLLVLDIEAIDRAVPVEPIDARILVVEDSATVRRAIARALHDAGAEVEEASDGLEAWERLASKVFDAVVTDLEMPRMGGFDLIERIRASSSLRDLAVAIVTSKGSDSARRRARALGVTHFFHKEWGERALTRSVARWFEGRSGKQSATSPR